MITEEMKNKLKNMTTGELLLSDDFKNLTINELFDVFNPNLKVNSQIGIINMKLRCKSDYNLTGDLKYMPYTINECQNSNCSCGGYSPGLTNSDDIFCDDENISKDYDGSDMLKTPEDDTQLVSDKDDDDNVKPFSDLNINELVNIILGYHDGRISFEDIKSKWKPGDCVKLTDPMHVCLHDGSVFTLLIIDINDAYSYYGNKALLPSYMFKYFLRVDCFGIKNYENIPNILLSCCKQIIPKPNYFEIWF